MEFIVIIIITMKYIQCKVGTINRIILLIGY